MASRRTLVTVSVVLIVAAVLLLWWQRRTHDVSSSDDEVAEKAADNRRSAKPIGAEAEQEERHSQLPWNRPGTSVSGRISDESGKPIAQADVCAVLVSPKLPNVLTREPKCTKSAADGRYTLAAVPPVRVEIHASAATFIPARHDPAGDRDYVDLHEGQATKDIDIVLRGGGVQIHGVVKDIAGGVIEGAMVKAQGSWGSAEGSSFTRSDAQGAFSLWVEPGDIYVEARADGYANGGKTGVAPGYTFEVLLTPESVLAGRVVRKSDGKPVANAYVTLGEWFWSDQVAYTDEGGNFRLDRLEPGRYKPVASDADGFGQLAESVRLGLGETVEGVVIEMHPMPSLRGRIVLAGDTQSPCEDGSVSAVGRISKHSGHAMTTHGGEIEILALLPDTYGVDVRCHGYVAEAKYAEIVVTDTAIDGVVWEVKPGLAVKGVVVDADGKPVARASVSARPVGTAARAQQTFAWGEQTDEAGAFELSGIIAGSYELHASHDDLVAPEEPTKITITDDERPAEQRLVLERGGTVQGRVVDADHRGVADAEVSVVGKRWGGSSARTADDGSFVIEAVRPGELRVVAQRNWSNDLRAPGTTDDDVQGERVHVSAGEVSTVELVVEEQFGKIAGKVVDADGGPVDDAFVHSTRESDSAATNEKNNRAQVSWGQWNRTPSLTEQDGSFTLDRLEIGKHSLMAMRKGGGEGVIEHIETGATGVVITLGEGGTLSGKVVLASGGTPKRFSMTVQERSQGIWRDEDFFETGGAWKIADLPAGKYTVAVTATEGSSDTEVELAAGAEKTGVSLTLTPKLDVGGTVVDIDTGAPVPGMKVSVTPRKGGGMFLSMGGSEKEDVSDDGGKFMVRAAPAGAVTVIVMPRSFFGSDESSYTWSRIPAQIPSDAPTYELPTLRIAKTRAKRNERAGDFGFTLKEGDPEAEEQDVPLQIAVIRPGSPAAGSELKIGDIIVEIDGKDVTGANKYLYQALTHVTEGDAVTFSVKDGGSVKLVAGKPI